MTTQVRVEEPRRASAGGSLSPEDFDDIAPCEAVSWSADGVLELTFSRDLTASERVQVQIRCQASTAAEEQLMLAGARAIVDNDAFLDLATVTTAQAVAQVRSLTRQVNGLLRLTLKQFDTDGGA